MSEPDSLLAELRMLLGKDVPGEAVHRVEAALLLAERLQRNGFEFRLLDARPKDPVATRWRAVFAKGPRLWQREHEDAALAVCHAVLLALEACEPDA